MKKLYNSTKNMVLSNRLDVADTFFSRLKGLMGRPKLEADSAMLITRCNSIHTCFMKFPIDVIFVDKNFRVKSIQKNIKPWRFTAPVIGSKSVIEFSAGVFSENQVEVGDILNVGH